MMETTSAYYREKMKSMNNIQTEIQEIKISIESICNRLNKGEDIIVCLSVTAFRISIRNYGHLS